MKRNAPKSLTHERSAQRKMSGGRRLVKSKGKSASAKEREQRIARGKRTLEELFAIGAELFKGLDTKTIIQIAEDKDLEYM